MMTEVSRRIVIDERHDGARGMLSLPPAVSCGPRRPPHLPRRSRCGPRDSMRLFLEELNQAPALYFAGGHLARNALLPLAHECIDFGHQIFRQRDMGSLMP